MQDRYDLTEQERYDSQAETTFDVVNQEADEVVSK